MRHFIVILLLAEKSVMVDIIDVCVIFVNTCLIIVFCELSVIVSHNYFTAGMAKDHTAVSRGEPSPLSWLG
jgi:hypothetical protein